MTLEEILSTYAPISLEEMATIRLMNRTDTKFVTTLAALEKLLLRAGDEYRIQETDGKRNLPYHTLYYDTPAHDMFMAHHNGKKTRQKVRIRSYLNSGLSFLEVKSKNNHGRTDKRRIQATTTALTDEANSAFLCRQLRYAPDTLTQQLENRFDRITLVNRRMTERLTIDTSIRFRNLLTGNSCFLPRLVIIELKRDGLSPSPIRALLRELRIHPAGFSKYCMGMALTDTSLKQNRFKERIRALNALQLLNE